MFAQTWRSHWGLTEDPFAHEDADKDPVLSRVDAQAVHSCFDRIYGNPATPGPGIVFGEKGSGKSGLRLAIQRRLEQHNEANPDARVFQVEYIEFDNFLESYRRRARLSPDAARSAPELVARFDLADHLDSVLSLGVTRLVDSILDAKKKPKRLAKQAKFDLLVLASLYYNSGRNSTRDAFQRLRGALRYRSSRPGVKAFMRVLLGILGVALLLVPLWNAAEIGRTFEHGQDLYWYIAGGLVLAGTGLWILLDRSGLRRRALQATRSVRVLSHDPIALVQVLETVSRDAREEVTLPIESNEATRYHLFQRFVAVLEAFGYDCVYVMLDRVDESTLLGGKEDLIRPFIEKLLDHKLLQHPGLALKLFLPIELSKMYLGASPDELKRMRLDKSNTVQELRWTGQELYEVANQRLRAAGAKEPDLEAFLGDDLDGEMLRETLHELGTPRHAFGFLSSLFAEFARNLPEELSADSSEWRVPRSHFDLVRAAWGDRARVLRRALN